MVDIDLEELVGQELELVDTLEGTGELDTDIGLVGALLMFLAIIEGNKLSDVGRSDDAIGPDCNWLMSVGREFKLVDTLEGTGRIHHRY